MTQPPSIEIRPDDRRAPRATPPKPSWVTRFWAGRSWAGHSWRGRLVRLALNLAIWGGLAGGIAVAIVAATLPKIDDLGHAERHPSVTLRAADGSLVATYGDLYGEALHLSELPKALPEALIATEDRRFYHHIGLDPVGILRAILVDLRAGHAVQGGSTLTQQLAKNLFLTPDRTLLRKLQEMLLALRLEHRFTKDQILEIYLNRVYFGAGAYGVDAASRRYFGKSARRLDLYESALLAGLLKAPTRYSPAGNRARAAARADQVLANMVDVGDITAAERTTAARQAVALVQVPAPQPGMRYFADWIEDQAAAGGYHGDLLVTTTLDPRLQSAGESVLRQSLDRDGAKDAVEQAALIAMSPDGAIRAMVGGRDYEDSQFNRATQANRQPGSAFKPFVYLAALEQGMSPGDVFVDGPVRIGNWQPHDFEPHYEGEMTMADAIAQSINTIAAVVAQRVGVRNVISVARRLGITGELPADASLALGTGEVTLIDLTSAYCAFASGGNGAWPYGIVEIRDGAGKLLYRRHGGGPGRVVAPEYAEEMNEMLAGVIDHGTGRAAQIGRPAAGKTGTTSDFRDALFVGYTPELVTGVWFGNDDNSPMNHITGGMLPAHAWHDFMLAALKAPPPHDIEPLRDAAPPVAVAVPHPIQPVQPVASPSDDDAFMELLRRAQEGARDDG